MRPARTRLRTTLILAPVLVVAAALVAAPVSAVEVLDTSGNPGTYSVKDTLAKPGVTCRFEDRAAHIDEQLDRISARSLKIRGHKPSRTWVGYRFRVYQRAALETDYELVFKGPLTKRRASASDPARFPARSWSPPEDLAASDFRVILDLFWFKSGSKSQVRGKFRGVMEVYRHVHPAEDSFRVGSPGDGGECFYNFWT